MSATIETPFLPIYDERNHCYRAVIEVTDGDVIQQYYCRLDHRDEMLGTDIYDGLHEQAMFQHSVLNAQTHVRERLAA